MMVVIPKQFLTRFLETERTRRIIYKINIEIGLIKLIIVMLRIYSQMKIINRIARYYLEKTKSCKKLINNNWWCTDS